MMKIIVLILIVGGVTCTEVSSRERCTKNVTFKEPAAGSCKEYWECNNGTVTYKTCGRQYSFDPEKSECVRNPKGSDKDCDNIKGKQNDHMGCSIGKTFKVPINGICNSYYYCQDGTLTTETCGWPMEFNPKDNECQINVWPYSFQCYNPQTSTPQQSTTKQSQTEKVKCKEGSTRAIPNQSDCYKYYKCENGIETINECKYWKQFDATTNECRYSTPWNEIKCNKPMTATTPKPISTTPVSTSLPATTKSPKNPSELVCLKGNYYRVVDRADCQKYSECSNGTLSVQQCMILHRFDHVSYQCKLNIPYYNNVNCKAPSDKPECKVGYYYKTSYPGDSNKYYDCNNGKLEEKLCGRLKAYEPLTQQCRWSVFGFNLNARNNQAIKQQHNRLSCKEGPDFNETYTGDCHMYWACHNGTLSVAECPYSQKFDSHYRHCTTMTQCDLLTCIAKGPLCYPGVHYLTTIPGQCEKYSECKDGKWNTLSCPWLHKFNPSTLECTFSLLNSVDCEATTKCQNKSLINMVTDYRQKESVKSLIVLKEKYEKPTCEKDQIYKTVFPYDCSKYYDCKLGKLKVEKCSMYQKFDPTTLVCRYDLPWNRINCASQPVGPKCERGQKFKSVYPGNCKKYFNCVNGTQTTDSCFWLKKFDPATLECSWDVPFHRVNCSAEPAQQQVYPEKLKNNCIGGRTFNAVDKENCQNYFSCAEGVLSHESCGYLMKFNPQTLSCSLDLPLRRVNCTADLVQPTCREKGIKRQPYPGDCKKYYECNNGTLSIKLCGMMHEFDHSKNECALNTVFSPVDCGIDG